MRVLVVSCVFGLSVFALMYWNYHFDGMIVEESWSLYIDTGENHSGSVLGMQTDFLHLLFTKRGSSYLTHLALVPVGSTPVFVNALSIGIQALNFILFAFIVWKLAGWARVFPILFFALLYPFASSAHFWQIHILHHLAILFFFVSLALFLCASWSRDCRSWDLLLYGLTGLGSYWLSLSFMEHAILMPLLFLYLALYNSNERSVLLLFKKLWSPSVVLAVCYCAVSLVFALTIFPGHSRLTFLSPTNLGRFSEWASWLHIPLATLMGLVVGINVILFFAGAVLANSVGYLGYPLMAVLDNTAVLGDEMKHWGLGIGLVALLGAWGFYVSRFRPADESKRDTVPDAFLVLAGLLWALLAYLPMSISFAYPRVVGQIADRVNSLALFGVSLCLGATVLRLTSSVVCRHPVRMTATLAGYFLATSVLLFNLCIQREYWVEAYRKESTIAMEVLNRFGQDQQSGHNKPLVFLSRDQKFESVRVRLNRALEKPGMIVKLLDVAKVVLTRHFMEKGEIEVTKFHLRGIPLFGGAPDGAQSLFDNYAQHFSLSPIPVFKIDYGVSLREDAERFSVGYDHVPKRSFSKHEYKPIVLKLDESFFHFRGRASFRIQPYVLTTDSQ